VAIVLHDPDLSRTTTGSGPIAALRYSELAGVRLRNGEPILTIAEAIDLLRGRCPVYIDLKDERAIEPLVLALKRARAEGAIVGASRPDPLRLLHRLAPKIPTSLLVHETGEGVVDAAKAAGARFVHPCWERCPDPTTLLTPELFTRARAAGLQVILWHEERPEELAKIARLGNVFGVCTNAPDLARRILGRPSAG
jgi:glycerophosphoryl diester phosphodiesterase